jgi:ABC-type Zn2+ transport system substrate-binding protein/surface adhesin
VTPVLAQILAGQGAYEEAIKIYKKLIEQRPQEKEKYEEEIRKLEEKMRDEDHA